MDDNREMVETPTKVFVDVYDLTGEVRPEGREPGFYYNIPYNADGELDRDDDIHLVGPFPTNGAAREAGIAFIEDALTAAEGLPAASDEEAAESLAAA